MLVDTLGAQAPAAARTDWHALARGARVKRFAGQSALLAFLLVTLGWIVKWALVAGLIAVAVLGLAYLFVDRR